MAKIREYLEKQGYDFSKPTKKQQFLAKQNYGNLDKEIVSLNDTLTDLFTSGKWRDAPTMKGYSDSLSSTLEKVKGYKDYITKYHANDKGAAKLLEFLSDTESYYTGATDNLNYLTSYYGSHTNAKAFADQKAKDDAKAAELLKLQELAKNADFADRSGYEDAGSVRGGRYGDLAFGTPIRSESDTYKGIYNAINNVEGQRYAAFGGLGADFNAAVGSLTDEEKALYNYISNTQGHEAGYDYIQKIADTLNYRKGKEIANSWAGRNLPLLTSLVSGVDSAQQGLTNAVNSIVNPNKERPTSAMQYAGGLIGQREMEEGVVQGLAAQISQSIGQMTPQILVSLATGNVGGAAKGVASAASKILSMATLGASVYGNAYNEALQRGQDGWRAYGYGLGNAAVEIAAESFADGINLISSGSWGKALATKLTGNKFKAVTEIVAEIADKPRIKYLLDALGEGAEEVFSTALEPALESFFLKETFDPASVEEMLYSGLLGALTSGVMNAPGVPGQVANYKYYSGMNRELNDADIDTIRAEAMQMGEKSKSYNAAKEFEGVETKDLANRHRRRILESFDAENHEKASEIVGNAIARNYAESENKNDNVDKAAEKAAEMKGKYNTATDGRAYTKDGTEADFSDFTETVEIDDEGNAVFTAKDGRTLSTADDVVPEIVAEGVAMLANLPSIPKSAYSTYFQYLPKQTNTKAYTEAFETLFKMGQNAEGMKLATSAAFADAELDEMSQGAIYLQGVNTRKSASEAFDDAVIKAVEAASKDGGFSYKEGKYDDSKIKNLRLSKEQKKIAQLAKAFTKFGLNVKFIASTKAERAKGTVGNGAFEPSTGTIILDINAGENESVLGSGLLWTISHELTHALKVTALTEFATLQEYILGEMFENEDALDRAIDLEKKRHNKVHPDEKPMTRAEAKEEIVARSCENILMDTDAFAKLIADGEQKTPGFAEKIVEVLTNIIDEIVNFFKSLSSEFRSDSEEANFFDKHAEKYEGLKEKWIAAFEKGMENAKVVYGTELTPGEEGVVVDADGNPVAYATKTGSVMLSMRTYREEGKDAFRKYLEKCVKNKSLTQEEMTEMLDGIEEIYKICSEFKDKYAPFSKWSDAEVIRDTKGKPVFSVVTPNGEYKMNLDFSLVCKKRRTLDAVFNEMARRGTIDNFELGQKSIVKINEIIRKYGFETACALCFVDAKRFRQASMADAFVNLYNELVRSLVPEENQKDIGFYNFSGNITVKNVESKIDRWESSKLDFSHINHVMKTYDDGTVEYKAAKYIKNNAHARKLLLRGDFMSSAGFDSVKKVDPQILKLYNSKKGTGGPKAAFGDVQYFNEIIKKAKSWTPSKAYSVGGIRVQSFSDYVPRMVFDYVQMIYDLAATKLPAHAYSKEALFVKQFGLTGIKINMSLIPAVAKNGVAPGLDKNGNYVWAGESFDFETAKKIQNADGYTENCGTIAVGVSYDHIMKLLSDPEIRMVIPYHKSGLNPIVAHMNRISAFTDYTSLKTNPGGGQHTTNSEGKNVKEEFDFNKALRELNDPKAAAQAYLDWCKENKYSPKFAEFSHHANYYKLLIDFTVYDKNGNYVPQRAVKAVFPKGEDAFGSMKELIKSGLEEDAVIEGERDERLGDIVDEIEKTLPKTEAEIAEDEVPQAETDVEARIMYSDRRPNRDREILAEVIGNSKLQQKFYYYKKEELKKYENALESYNKALAEVERIEKEIHELPRGNTQNSRVKKLKKSLEFYYGRLQTAEEKMFTYEAEGLRDVIDAEIRRLNEVARKTGIESRREAIRERVERASRAVQIASINNSVKDTMKMLNADTKHKYVPDALKQPVINILTALDFTKSLKDGTVTKSSQALDDAVQGLSEIDVSDLKVQLAELKTAIKDNVTPGGDGFAFDLNEDTVEVLEDAVNKLAEIKEQLNNMPEKNIYSMDSESLEAVKVALKVLNTVIRNADKAFASGMDISDAARGTISEVSARPEANKGKVATYFRSNLYFKLVDPIRQFAKMGPEALKMFKALMEADSRRAFLVERVREFIQKEIGSENLKKWDKQTFTFDNIPVINSEGAVEVDKNGNEVTQSITVTATQIMALHCHWQRNQSKKHLANMNEDGEPIKTGGGVFRKKLDSGEYEESARVRFDDALVSRMVSELSKEQIEAADKMQSYMSNELAELGNMVSYKRWGINAFTEKYYIPIVTKKGVHAKEDDSGKAGNLLKIINKSWTKRVLKNAKGPMYIDSLTEAFTGHAIEMIDYNTFALPILDIVRWLNFENTANGADESVSQSIEKAFGKDGIKFVKTLIEDINGSSSKPTAGIGMQKFFLRNTKLALVGGKIKQVFLQPTSVVGATEVISYSSLRKGVGTVLKVGDPENNVKGKIELARKWSGTALWKSMGYIDTNFGAKTFAERILEEDAPGNIKGRMTHDIKNVLKGIKGKDGKKAYDALVDASLIWMEKGDEIGWAVLWAACESDVLATQKSLVPKSDEFYKAVARLFDEVVYKTQVTDSVLAKSASLRSTNTLETMTASFMGEPIKSINGVIDVTERIVADSKRLGKKAAFLKHKNELFKEVTVFATRAFTVALVSAIADHIGDDEEDLLDYKLFIKKFGSNIFEEINPLMKIPYIADIANIVVYGYDSSRLDLEAFSEVQQAFTAVINGIQGDGKYTSWGVIMQILEAASLISGVSAQNMLKDAKDAWNATIGEVFEEAEWREKKK